jgi:hypothetical protein
MTVSWHCHVYDALPGNSFVRKEKEVETESSQPSKPRKFGGSRCRDRNQRNRMGTLMRLMDTAISDWFFQRDPFAIHLLVCASYMVLADLGRKDGKGPIIEKHFGRFSMTTVYDFLRHAKPDMLNDSVDLVPGVTEWMLFDAITSFQSLYSGSTAYMRTFDVYYALHPSVGAAHPNVHKHAADFLPN